MRKFSLLIVAASVGFAGCMDSTVPSTPVQNVVSVNVPYVDSDALKDKLAPESGPIVVEFCIPFGCSKCDLMREQFDQLATDFGEQCDFFRIDLNSGQALAAEYGVRVCPSYVCFDKGQAQLLASYPTSGGLLAGAIDSIVEPPDPELPSSQLPDPQLKTES